jgi:hypothetical protein
MKRGFFVLFIFLVPLVVSLEVSEVSCPQEVSFEEEFSCEVEITDLEDIYDLKFYITGDSGGINRIWDGETFVRADWYQKRFVEAEGVYTIKAIIHKEFDGEASGELKLRDSKGKVAKEKPFTLDITHLPQTQSPDEEEEEESVKLSNTQEEEDSQKEQQGDDEEEDEKEEEESKEDLIVIDLTTKNEVSEADESSSKKVINLNGQAVKEEKTLYTSKQYRVKDYLIYTFMILLVGIIGYLLIDRRW